MAFETLHIHHASLNGRDDAGDARNDSRLMFGRDADVVTTTEMGAEPQRSEWLAAAKAAGYKTLTGRGGQAIAVKRGIKTLNGGYTQVIDDPTGPVKGHRDLPWITIEFAGRHVTVCSTHWVDDYETNADRRAQWNRQTDAVISRMDRSVTNDDNVGFFTGDVNIHFDQNGPMVNAARGKFHSGNLRMVWEDLNIYPDTGPHGGTIDVIGRRGGGKFVTAMRTQVYTSAVVTSDHNPISAWYRIEVLTGAKTGGGGGGGHGSGPPPVHVPPPSTQPQPTAHSGKGRASLAGKPFRLNPTSLNWTFTAKVADIATVGGKVIQVLGTSVSDIHVSGTFGAGGWREQAEFLDWIKEVADRQTQNKPPVHFRYPAYGWNIPVYIKAFTSPDGSRAIVLDNGVIAPRWDLTLFVVDSNASLDKVAKDAYIRRLAKGIGWKQTKFNGPVGIHALSEVLGGQSVEQYLEEQYGIGSVPTGNIDYEDSSGTDTPPVVAGPLPAGGTPDQNRRLGQSLASMLYGWTGDQWTSLNNLWTRESGWSTTADNPTSSAYGIPQSLPGSKMASVADDWRTNPETQIRWGLKYIKGRYGDPNTAWAHSQAEGWY